MTTARGRTPRSAFTILEMLLVMTVIVMATSLVIAGIDSLRTAYRLPRAADDLRGMLAGLRARAMEEANVIEFSFEPDSSRYRIRLAGGDVAEGSHAAASELELDGTARMEFDDPEVFGEHDLPSGLALVEGRGNASRATNQTSQDATEATRMTLRFQPDGSCTGLAFVLKDLSGGEVHFHVRALTGAVKTARKGADGREMTP
jgi:hypothetical protein